MNNRPLDRETTLVLTKVEQLLIELALSSYKDQYNGDYIQPTITALLDKIAKQNKVGA